jgi:hypothetical protein
VNFLQKNFCWISQKKIGSANAQSPQKFSSFEILAKIKGKGAIFFENSPRAYKDLI